MDRVAALIIDRIGLDGSDKITLAATATQRYRGVGGVDEGRNRTVAAEADTGSACVIDLDGLRWDVHRTANTVGDAVAGDAHRSPNVEYHEAGYVDLRFAGFADTVHVVVDGMRDIRTTHELHSVAVAADVDGINLERVSLRAVARAVHTG